VVGINAAINAAGQGIGFAIPINMAKTLLPQLARDGSVRRSWIGVVTQPVNRALARSFRLPGQPRGALVTEVVAGGPAARAGLRSGDIVVEFAGHRIERSDDLPWLASTAGVGRRVPVVVFRNGSRNTVTLTLAAMPGSSRRPPARPRRPAASAPSAGLGIAVRPAHPSLLPAGTRGGVLVTSLSPDGRAAQLGLQRGDVILEIGGTVVDSVATYHRLAGALRAGQVVRFRVIRNRRPYYFAFEYGR
jgi:S1-C subfamily serine protease